MRLAIEITEAQHQRIKALAAMRGLSIKDYILEKAIPLTADELAAMEQLKAQLTPRLTEAQRGELYEGTMENMLTEAHEGPEEAH